MTRLVVEPRGSKRVMDLERCRRRPHYFLFDSGFLLTKDEHDHQHPVKPFPDVLYLRAFLDCLLVSGHFLKPSEANYALEAGCAPEALDAMEHTSMLCVEKSRQLMATWIVCAYLLWRAKFRPHQLILVQSKREDDAAALVYGGKDPTFARMSFMETSLPKEMKSVEFPKGATFGHLYFPNGSHIWAIPEGSDVIRSQTPSVLFSDEAAFQPEFGAAYSAARPAIDGGGQMVCISSAEPGAYAELIEAA